jgi:menaquinone-dependent protoporphyrinogen oxidase
MRVLIAYRSKYGTTAACARLLGAKIRAEAVIVDLARQPWPDAREFDVVLIGGSIYGAKIQREVSTFCERQREKLLNRRVGLFLCSMYQGELAQTQLQGAFPKWLLEHAFVTSLFGGELHRARLTLWDRFSLLGNPRWSQEVLHIDQGALESTVAAVNALCTIA